MGIHRAKPSLKPGPFICMLIPRMLFHTPLHLMEALSLEPCKVWSTYFAPLAANCGNFAPVHVPCLQSQALSPRAQKLSGGPSRRTNLCVQPSSGSILRRARDKALRPGRRVPGQSARHFVGQQALGMLLALGKIVGTSRSLGSLLSLTTAGMCRGRWFCPSCPSPSFALFPQQANSRSLGHKAQGAVG